MASKDKDSRYIQPDYECRFCPGLLFKGSEWHRRNCHLRQEHRMAITWNCPVCSYKQSSRRFTDLMGHIKVKHGAGAGKPIPELFPIDDDSSRHGSQGGKRSSERVSTQRRSPRKGSSGSKCSPRSHQSPKRHSPRGHSSRRLKFDREVSSRHSSPRQGTPSPEPSPQPSTSHSTQPRHHTSSRGELHLSLSPPASRRKSSTPRKVIRSTVTAVTVAEGSVAEMTGQRQTAAAAVAETRAESPSSSSPSSRSPSPSSRSSAASPDISRASVTVQDVQEFLSSATPTERETIRRSLRPRSKSKAVQASRGALVVHTQEGGVNITTPEVTLQVRAPLERLEPSTP